jgi:nitrogen-specific signal transduction histidine kinase
MLSGGPLHQSGDFRRAETPHMSARRVLTQHPVPVIAVADDGAIVFANTAFADLLGCSCKAVTTSSYEDICSFLPPNEILLAVTRLGPGPIGRALQLGQATLFVKMRRSAIVSTADWGPIRQFEGLLQRLHRLAAP